MAKLKPEEFARQALFGMARVQARQEAMECVIRALIQHSVPLHPLIELALHTAQSDLDQRWASVRDETPPELAAAGLSLLNEFRRACASSNAPPDAPTNTSPGP